MSNKARKLTLLVDQALANLRNPWPATGYYADGSAADLPTHFATGYLNDDGSKVTYDFSLTPLRHPLQAKRRGRPKNDALLIGVALAMDMLTARHMTKTQAQQQLVEWGWYSCDRAAKRVANNPRLPKLLKSHKALVLHSSLGPSESIGVYIDPSANIEWTGSEILIRGSMWVWSQDKGKEAEFLTCAELRMAGAFDEQSIQAVYGKAVGVT